MVQEESIVQEKNDEACFTEDPDTIFSYLDFWIVGDCCFDSEHPKGSEHHLEFLSRTASFLKDDIAAKITSGEVFPIETDKHEEFIAMLFALEQDPSRSFLSSF